MSKQVLSIEQMKHLKELGVDTSKASMVLLYTDDEGEIIEWEDADEFPEKFVELYDAETGNYDHSYRRCCGVFTLQDILDLLPKKIDEVDVLIINPCKNIWSVSYAEEDTGELYGGFIKEELIDAAYEMLCWCVENEYVKTEK